MNEPNKKTRIPGMRCVSGGIMMPALFFVLIFTGITSVSVSAQEVIINNNLVVEADGTLRMDSAATVWNDIMVFPDATTKGGANPPEWGTKFKSDAGNTTMGVYLWMFPHTAEKELYYTIQIPHDYKLGSDLYPHVHWTTVTGTPSGTDVVWGLEYTIATVGASFPYTVILKSHTVYPGCVPITGPGHHIITQFEPIDGTGLGISTMLVCRLFRATNDAADSLNEAVGFMGFDLHYEQDTQGSRQQWTK